MRGEEIDNKGEKGKRENRNEGYDGRRKKKR